MKKKKIFIKLKKIKWGLNWLWTTPQWTSRFENLVEGFRENGNKANKEIVCISKEKSFYYT